MKDLKLSSGPTTSHSQIYIYEYQVMDKICYIEQELCMNTGNI